MQNHQTQNSNKTLWIVLGLIIGVPTLLMGGCAACVVLLGMSAGPKQTATQSGVKSGLSGPTATNAQQAPAPTPCPTVTPGCPDFHLLQVVKSNWEKGGFGTVAVWNVTFRNTSKRSIGNIKYRTSYDAETGAEVDKGGTDSLLGKDTIQKVIRPGEKRTIEINDGFVHDEAARASFSVVSWEYVP